MTPAAPGLRLRRFDVGLKCAKYALGAAFTLYPPYMVLVRHAPRHLGSNFLLGAWIGIVAAALLAAGKKQKRLSSVWWTLAYAVGLFYLRSVFA